MICTCYNRRFAPHPPEDYMTFKKFVLAKNSLASKRRLKVLQNNKKGICGRCIRPRANR